MEIPIMVYNSSSGWRVVYGNARAEKEIERLAVDVRADFGRIVGLIECYGLDEVHEPYVKHLRGKLWEMRMRGKDGIARAAYIAAEGKRVVILHAFVKKTQRTPPEAIELALKRAKELGLL
jgi:phage-related protein